MGDSLLSARNNGACRQLVNSLNLQTTYFVLALQLPGLIANSFRHSGKIQRYGVWGLLLFVAVPLPGTGVWSGSLAAVLLDIRFKWAFAAILVGNLIAGLLIMGVSHEFMKVVGG
jgi:uncharacterized membrane protein